jgi:hypothetical protein
MLGPHTDRDNPLSRIMCAPIAPPVMVCHTVKIGLLFCFVLKKKKPSWSVYYSGAGLLTDHEKEGPRPWPGFIRGFPINSSFFFFLHPTATIFRPDLEEGLLYTFWSNVWKGKEDTSFVKQQKKRVRTDSGSPLSISRRGQRSLSGTKKGFKKHFSMSPYHNALLS